MSIKDWPVAAPKSWVTFVNHPETGPRAGGPEAKRVARCTLWRGSAAEADGRAFEVRVEPASPVAAKGRKRKRAISKPFSPCVMLGEPRSFRPDDELKPADDMRV